MGHVRKVTLGKNDRAAVLAQTISPLNYQQNLAALSLRTMLLFPVIDKLQMPPNSSQNLPKSVPKSPQIDPKGLLEPIWDRWLKKQLDLKTPKNSQGGPQSAQRAPTWPPRPFEMEAKNTKKSQLKTFRFRTGFEPWFRSDFGAFVTRFLVPKQIQTRSKPWNPGPGPEPNPGPRRGPGTQF